MNSFSFDPSESLAVARLVWVLIFSDNRVDRRESDFFEQMLLNMNISSQEFEFSLSEPIERSYSIVREMPIDKRRECARVLKLAVETDEVVKLSELSRLNDILEKTAIFKSDKFFLNKFEGGF